MALSQAAVAEIKCLHQACELTLAEIGARYGIAATTVSKLARIHGWPSRSQLMGRASPSFRPMTARSQARLVRRFYDTIGSMLARTEKNMAEGNLSGEDFERIGKSVAAMIAGLSKVMATVANGDEKQRPEGAEPAAAADEAERLHREIIERFERIQTRRNAEAGSK